MFALFHCHSVVQKQLMILTAHLEEDVKFNELSEYIWLERNKLGEKCFFALLCVGAGYFSRADRQGAILCSVYNLCFFHFLISTFFDVILSALFGQ